jgi:ankyrin repeat protein
MNEMKKYLEFINENTNNEIDIFKYIYGNNDKTALEIIKKEKLTDIISDDGKSLLYECVDDGKYELVKQLIENGADVNFKNEDGFVPIIPALLNDFKKITKILVDKGINYNIKLNDNHTLLSYLIAVDYNCKFIEFVDNMIDLNVDLNTELEINIVGKEYIDNVLFVIITKRNNEKYFDIFKKIIDKGVYVSINTYEHSKGLYKEYLISNLEIQKKLLKDTFRNFEIMKVVGFHPELENDDESSTKIYASELGF